MMDKRIGERIKIARKAVGMTQDDLASLLGYKHKSSITKIEAGETDLPTEKMNALAETLGVSTVYLATGMEPPAETTPLKGWVDELTRVATQLSRNRRIQLIEYAQYLQMLDQRDTAEAYMDCTEPEQGDHHEETKTQS